MDFPKLNDFGKAFKDAGFKFPKDDETFIKVPPVMLGSPAQKELWPHTIWPGTIPGLPPIGLRFNTFFQVVGKNRNNFNLQAPGDPTVPFIPRTDFQSGLFSIFMAGNFGDDIAFWVDDDISVGVCRRWRSRRWLSEVREHWPPSETADRFAQPADRAVRARSALSVQRAAGT